MLSGSTDCHWCAACTNCAKVASRPEPMRSLRSMTADAYESKMRASISATPAV
jgi:hypothetical protein